MRLMPEADLSSNVCGAAQAVSTAQAAMDNRMGGSWAAHRLKNPDI
jgi:hypothetical protein